VGEKTQKVISSKFERAFSAGGVVFKKKDSQIGFLLINPKDTDRWQFPKGLIDKGENSQEAAIREVAEEGGVEARIIEKLDDIKLFYFWEGKRIFKIVTYYLMEYLRDTGNGHDEEIEKVKFLSYEDALKKLTFKNDKDLLKKAKEKLEQGIQKNLI
jgi:8-oxo-dGTP diphosphatase